MLHHLYWQGKKFFITILEFKWWSLGYEVHHKWTRKNIFWELQDWKDNLIRHNFDAMHIQKKKNVFDNVLGKEKSKDNLSARKYINEIFYVRKNYCSF